MIQQPRYRNCFLGAGWKRVTLGKSPRSLFPPLWASLPFPCRETQQGLSQPLLSSPWRANAELGTHMCKLLQSARTSTTRLGQSWSTSTKRLSMSCANWSRLAQGPPASAAPHMWQAALASAGPQLCSSSACWVLVADSALQWDICHHTIHTSSQRRGGGDGNSNFKSSKLNEQGRPKTSAAGRAGETTVLYCQRGGFIWWWCFLQLASQQPAFMQAPKMPSPSFSDRGSMCHNLARSLPKTLSQALGMFLNQAGRRHPQILRLCQGLP